MSRGPGAVQRSVLSALLDEPVGVFVGWRTVSELTARVYGKGAGRSQVESVRRAMKSLATAGKLELDYMDESTLVHHTRFVGGDGQVYRRAHYADRAQLCGHLPLSVEEREHLEQWLGRMAALDARIDGWCAS